MGLLDMTAVICSMMDSRSSGLDFGVMGYLARELRSIWPFDYAALRSGRTEIGDSWLGLDGFGGVLGQGFEDVFVEAEAFFIGGE